MRYDTVIFDLDGTLLNTLDDLAAATNYALARMGWPARTTDEVRAFVGNGAQLLIRRAAPPRSAEEELQRCLELFKARYQAHRLDATAPYPGVTEMLEALRKKGCRLAVCSNKFDAAVKELARDFFPGVMDAAAGENEAAGIPKKPHPAMVHTIMAALKAAPERTVYVGDADTDIDTARNAGIPCVSVTWGFRDRAFLLAHGAQTLIDTPMELVDIISK